MIVKNIEYPAALRIGDLILVEFACEGTISLKSIVKFDTGKDGYCWVTMESPKYICRLKDLTEPRFALVVPSKK